MDLRIQSTEATPSNVCLFDTLDPNIGGTVFDPADLEADTDTVFVSESDASTWVYNGSSYITKAYEIPDNTPFFLYGTSLDAGGNKTSFIQRNGPMFINSSSSNGSRYAAYLYSRRTSGAGNGVLIRKDLRTTSGNYLLVQGWNSSTGEIQDKLKVGHNGGLTINNAYTLPTADGTAGQVPTTDGAGNVTWEDGGSSGVFGISDTTGKYTYYDTLTLAMAAATSGDTIEMFADVVESGAVTITLKDGVNINGNGHTYTYTNATGNTFIDNGIAISCNIHNLNIVRNNYTSGNVYNQSNTSSDTDWSGSKIYFTAASSYACEVRGYVRNMWVKAIGNAGAIYSMYAVNCYLYNCYGESTGSGTGLDIRTSYLYSCIGKSNSGKGGFCAQSNVYDSTFISVSNYGCDNGTHYNCTAISNSSFGFFSVNVNNSVGVSTSSVGINPSSGIVRNSVSISGAGVGGSTWYNSIIISNLSQAVTQVIGSYYNCTIQSTWNNASGHALNSIYASGGDIVNCFISVANTSANCINTSLGATTVNYANNTFKGATTPVKANIVQGITNTSDAQGNILI